MISLTWTEKLLLGVLLDEQPHDRYELLAAFGGSSSEDLKSLYFHLSNLRNKLRPDILIVSHETTLHTRNPDNPRRLQGAYRLLCVAGPTLPPERLQTLKALLEDEKESSNSNGMP